MTKRALLICLGLLLAVPASPGGAQESPVACGMHLAHSGAHERDSCGMTRLGAVEVSAEKGLGQIEIQGNRGAVIQREDGKIAILDVTDPAAPRVLGRYDGGVGRPEVDDPYDGDAAFSHDGRFLFYARQTHDYSNEGLHVLDIADPAAPKLVAFGPQGGMLRVAYYRDTAGVEYAITQDAIAGLTIFRFERTPAGGALVPVFLDALPQLKVGGPASAGLVVDPKDPKLGVPLLYASNGTVGLDVFNIANPAQPVKLGSWTVDGLADIELRATAESRTVYAATEYWFDKATKPRVVELDATNLAAIVERRRVSPADPDYSSSAIGWQIQGIELAGDNLYITHAHGGVGVLPTSALDGQVMASTTDLGDPNTGGEFKSAATSPYAMDVEVSGDAIYVSDASTGTLSTFRLGSPEA